VSRDLVRRRFAEVDGRRMSYLEGGSADAPAILLLHGLMSDASTWDRAVGEVAARGFHVLALDLPGHGHSDEPASGYGLVDFAADLSRFLPAAGIDRAVIGGHSLGGAIAMQFAHHYPEQADGLVLVCAGGLGRQVHPVLRLATLPGARAVVRAAVNGRTAPAYQHRGLHRALRLGEDAVTNLGRMGRAIVTPTGRHAFFETLHSVIEPGGQRGSMIEMGYLSAERPTLIVWAEHDPILPVTHAHDVHRHLPGSRLVLVPGVSHEPHRRHPDQFADALADYFSGASRTRPVELHDSTDQRDAADKIDPTLAQEPIENAENADPIEPIEKTDPIEPIDMNEPSE
jgi:pimeloyl-ACP methyl ester carboxylesterase